MKITIIYWNAVLRSCISKHKPSQCRYEIKAIIKVLRVITLISLSLSDISTSNLLCFYLLAHNIKGMLLVHAAEGSKVPTKVQVWPFGGAGNCIRLVWLLVSVPCCLGLASLQPSSSCPIAVLLNEPKRVFVAGDLLQKHFSFLTLFTGYAHTYHPSPLLRGGEKSSSFIFSPLDLHLSMQAAALSLHPKCFASCSADPCGGGLFSFWCQNSNYHGVENRSIQESPSFCFK